MKNVNRKKKSYALEVIFALVAVGFGIYFCLHMAFVSTSINMDDKDKKQNIYNLVVKASEHMEKKPFEFGLNNPTVRKNFVDYQKWFLLLYVVAGLLIYASKGMSKGEYAGMEHGSAEWANETDKKYFKVKSNTIIGNRLYLRDEEPMKKNKKLRKRIKDYNYNRFIIGGPGSRKSFSDIKPNILLALDNYVVTDVKGEIFQDTSERLKSEGYTIKVLNLIEPKYSMKFNPFQYVSEDNDIIVLADTFMKNTENGKNVDDSFWYKAEFSLLQALMFYVYKELPKAEWNFPNVMKLLLSAIQVEQDNKSKESVEINKKLTLLDVIFGELEEKNPDHIALSAWKMFKLSAGETSASIMVGLAVRFSIFTTEDIKRITSSDEMELDRLAEEKVAIYLMIPDTHRTYDLISAMFFSQLLQYLIHKADFEYPNKRLPRHVKILADEFYNCGYWPNFPGLASTIRSRNISATPVIQELNQLKSKYKDNWQTIIGCCDTIIFMGSPENETRKYISEMLGKTTVQVNSKSVNYGGRGGRSESVNYIQRDLMSPDELRVMPPDKQIVFVKGTKAMYIDKFKTEQSELYQYFSKKADYRKIINQDLQNEKKDIQYYETVEMVANELEEILQTL